MLMTRKELTAFIKNRHEIHAKFIQSQNIDDVVSSNGDIKGHEDNDLKSETSENVDSNDHENSHQGNSFFQRLLEIQIFIRMELYCILYPEIDKNNSCHSTDNRSSSSLASHDKDALKNLRALYGKIVAKEKIKKPKKGEKKSMKRKNDFTPENFATEICSVIELVPFIMPSITESFTDYIVKSIIAPYRSFGIVAGILDHFEIEAENNLVGESADKSGQSDVVNDDRSQQLSLEIMPVVKFVTDNMTGGKDKIKPSSPDQNSNEIQERKSVSRWDLFDVRGDCIDKEGKGSCDKSNTKHEKVTAVTNKRPEPSKRMKNSPKLSLHREIKVNLSSHNPLLANGRGTYVGRHLGNHDFNEVKIINSSNTSSKSRRGPATSGAPNSEVTSASNSEQESKKDKSRKQRSNPIASLGSAASFYRGNLTTQKTQNRKETRTESSERSPINSNRHGAALLAARARRYLSTKNRK